MTVRPGVELASLTDVGCRRENNEDSYSYWEPENDALFERCGRFALVADGMGGHEGGQIASRMAAEVVTRCYRDSQELDPQTRLLHAFTEAHQRIQQRGLEHLGLQGMGTTCTAFVVVKQDLYFAHVGDSRLYLLRDGHLRQLTRDHTLIARWLETGAIAPEEAETHPQKHVLTAALGVAEDIRPDFPSEPLPLKSGDVLLLCTDGLWGQVNQAEIAAILGSGPPDKACRALVDFAKTRGGPDNITLQILRIA